MLKAIIIDDVTQAISSLKADLADYCQEVEVIGTANGVVEGSKLLRRLNPDVVFLDIQMEDGTGFDLLEIIGDPKFKVIFTTSHNDYAIKAFKFSAIDYLLKPIDVDELKLAVAKVAKQIQNASSGIAVLKEFMGVEGKINRIALNTSDKIHIVNLADIIRCEASVNYTVFYISGEDKLVVSKPLKEYDILFKNLDFFRVHQSHLINLNQVLEYVKQDGGYLVMKDKSTVDVSSRKRAALLEVLKDFH